MVVEIMAGPQSPVEQGVRLGGKKPKNILLKVPASYLPKKKYLFVIYQGITLTYSGFRIMHGGKKSNEKGMWNKSLILTWRKNIYCKITPLLELEQIDNVAFKVINKLVLRNLKILFLCFKNYL